MPRNRALSRGDHWVVSDRDGFKYPSSECQREWNGLLVHKDEFERRQPQDFIRGKADRLSIPNARPEPVSVFTGPLVTSINAAAAAGTTNLTVESSARFEAGDEVRILLDNGDSFRVSVLSADTATTIQIANGLPWAASVGNAVVNESAVSPADIG